MRAIYLIARREYLSYVATVGFWLSLLSVPVFAIIGGSIPALIESSQPTRYYAVIDQTGQDLAEVIRITQREERRERARRMLTTLTEGRGEEVTERTLAAFDTDPDGLGGLDAALEEAGLSGARGLVAPERTDAVMVDAPARDVEALRPYLTGDRMVTTPEGERPLFAVFLIEDDPAAPLSVTYLSTNVTARELRNDIVSALRSHLREQAFIAGGLSPEEVDEVLSLSPRVTTIDARPNAGANAEVTRADRAPFIVAIVLAFILWVAVFSVANMLLTSLVEEKGGKIIELLLSTARFHEILIGKLAGVAGVSATLFLIWGAVGTVVTVLGGAALQSFDPRMAEVLGSVFDPVLLAAALFFFAAGYLMYGSIFLAMGSLCDTLQDAQTLMGPVIWTLMLPLLFLFFSLEASDSTLVRVASWVPLWTPFVMMARLPADPPLWEVLGASALMLATMLFVLWGAAAVFRQGALRQADADTVRRWFKLGGKKKSA
jgi:ABC-2 type transport system permease protein